MCACMFSYVRVCACESRERKSLCSLLLLQQLRHYSVSFLSDTTSAVIVVDVVVVVVVVVIIVVVVDVAVDFRMDDLVQQNDFSIGASLLQKATSCQTKPNRNQHLPILVARRRKLLQTPVSCISSNCCCR